MSLCELHRCEVLLPSPPSIPWSNVMVHITILPHVSVLKDGERWQNLQKNLQRIDLGSPTPLVGVLCLGFTSLHFCMGYREEAPDTGVTTPAPKT